MGWKEWPYWLKGGILGVMSSIIIVPVSLWLTMLFAFTHEIQHNFLAKSLSGILFCAVLPLFLSAVIRNAFGLSNFWVFLLAIPIFSVYYFLIGALIGLIVSKIKSK